MVNLGRFYGSSMHSGCLSLHVANLRIIRNIKIFSELNNLNLYFYLFPCRIHRWLSTVLSVLLYGQTTLPLRGSYLWFKRVDVRDVHLIQYQMYISCCSRCTSRTSMVVEQSKLPRRVRVLNSTGKRSYLYFLEIGGLILRDYRFGL